MRVISGVLKGRSINFLKNKNTRPLKDSVKESVFNILKHSNLVKTKIQNSNVLDLYSGIGSFGIECISRGAKKCIFVENYSIAKENSAGPHNQKGEFYSKRGSSGPIFQRYRRGFCGIFRLQPPVKLS